ncbi:MAG TPA: universal stress protein [Bacteroidia bacterium]|jgi:nucleotide-binding universal stress UspA family protein|nr:universal stress protein [Bacteroidia bacterium]
MLKKIICPVDFSDASRTALEYASHIARLTNAELQLLNYQQAMPHQVLSPISMRHAEIEEQQPLITTELEKWCREANRAFGITCSYEMDVDSVSLATAINEHSNENDLVIIGTNGADDIFQEWFGSNAFNVAKRSLCPVLIVPENFTFGTLRKLVFAWDYSMKKDELFNRLFAFAELLKTEIDFVHISSHATELSKDVFNAAKDAGEEKFGGKIKAEYVRIYSSFPAESIIDHMKEKHGDILALTFGHGKLAKKIIQGKDSEGDHVPPSFPILVFHE